MTTFEYSRNARPAEGRRLPGAIPRPAGDAGTLFRAVQAAARAINENSLKAGARHGVCLPFQLRMLLSLVTYCYCRQVYSSAAVEALLRSDANFCQVSDGQTPDASVIRRFRRENREALHFCLQAGLRFLAEQKVAQGIVTKLSESQITEEASRRIVMAMFTDSMEQDRDQTPETHLCYLVAKRDRRVH